MVRLTLQLARIALLAMIALGIVGIYAYRIGDRIEPMRAVAAYSGNPTALTLRAMDEATAKDSRIRWIGMSVSAGLLLIAVVGLYAIAKRLDAPTI